MAKKSGSSVIKGYQVLKNECVWMKGGVVNFRICDRAYDCFNCAFDKGMQKTMSAKTDLSGYKKPDWSKILGEKYDGDTKPCRYYLTGRFSAPKTCPLNYECYHCEFDQMMDEVQTGGRVKVPETGISAGYKIAEGYYYSKGHTWVCYEHGGRMRIGFDNFFTKLFGQIDSLSFPSLGKKVKAGESGIRFEKNGKILSAIYPSGGIVVKINHEVVDNPSLIHEKPYSDGWLILLEPDSAKKDVKNLYHSSDCFEFFEEENRKLISLLGEEYTELAATGGEPVDDIISSHPDIGIDNIEKNFLS